MATISIYYWHHAALPGLKYRHGEERELKARTLTTVIKTVTKAGYSIMIRPEKDTENLTVYIDNGRFGQK